MKQTPDNRSMPWIEWPEQDRAAWRAALTPAGFLEPGGVAAGWAEGGRRMVSEGYGRWLTWLARTEQLDAASSAASRVTREQVAAYADSLTARCAPMTIPARLSQLSQAMRAMASDRDWTWILRAANRLRAVAVPVRQKRLRMQESQALAELGIRLMRQAEATNDSFEVRRAALYRDGLIIALMAHRPLRLRSFSAITLGQHLTQRDTIWWLCFAATDMKTKQAMEMAFPLALVSHLKRYLDHHRPLLSEVRSRPGSLRPATSALWIATGGTIMCAAAIGAQIGKHTAAAFGAPINPHLFRDCAATSIAIHDPEHVRTIIPILGHATIATSERHYNQARTLEASRRYQQTLMGIRHDMRQDKERDGEIQRIERSRAYGHVGLRPLLVGAAVRTLD